MKRLMVLFLGCFLIFSGCESQEKKVESLTLQLSDENVEVRRAAVIELSKIGKPAVVPALMKALSDESEHVHSVAAEALVKIGKPAVPALMRGFDKTRSRDVLIDILVKIGKPAVPALIDALKNEVKARIAYQPLSPGDLSSDGEVFFIRFVTAGILAKIGEPAVPALLEILLSSDYENEDERRAIRFIGVLVLEDIFLKAV